MSETIKIKNYSDIMEEYEAHAAITPGHLVFLNSDDEVAVHAVQTGPVLPMFACEDELQGKGITNAYAAGDQVQVWVPGRGDIVNALLADGENVAIGDMLISHGDGTLEKYDGGSAGTAEWPNCIVGVAIEAVDMTVSNDPDGRIKVRIY